jgi:hypothetical protein
MLEGGILTTFRGATMTLSSHIRRANRPLLPSDQPQLPEETTWQRYSPNGEPVVAGLSSLLLHAALLAIILMGVWAIVDRPQPFAVAEFVPAFPNGDGLEGGGTANKNTNGLAPGAPPQNSDETKPINIDDANRSARVAPKDDVAVTPSRPAEENDPLGEAISKKLAGRTDRPALSKAIKDLLGPMKGPGVRGNSENRSGYGKVDGDWVGNRPGERGRGRQSQTWNRMQRWEITFSTQDARHYLQQLDALRAIFAVVDQKGAMMAVRDLKERPAQLELRDLVALDRMFWVDDRDDSVRSVAAELGLSYTPDAIIAFFPREFQDELVAKERAAHGWAESEIEFTKFAITFRGGKHVIRVTEQRRK